MAQNESNSGFTLPAPNQQAVGNTVTDNLGAAVNANANTSTAMPGSLVSINVGENTGSRDLLIGGAVILVLLVAFFFAKNAYANTLVGKRVPPNKANAAGWWLFVGLSCIAIGVVLSAVSSSRFMTPLVLGPLGGVGLLGLVLAVLSGRK